MKTKAVRLYGADDLRLEEFALPEINSGEILIKVICDSVCMSTYKTAKQGKNHLRVPNDVAEHPVIVGHEFCAEIVEVGERWKNNYSTIQKQTRQYKAQQMKPTTHNPKHQKPLAV